MLFVWGGEGGERGGAFVHFSLPRAVRPSVVEPVGAMWGLSRGRWGEGCLENVHLFLFRLPQGVRLDGCDGVGG